MTGLCYILELTTLRFCWIQWKITSNMHFYDMTVWWTMFSEYAVGNQSFIDKKIELIFQYAIRPFERFVLNETNHHSPYTTNNMFNTIMTTATTTKLTNFQKSHSRMCYLTIFFSMAFADPIDATVTRPILRKIANERFSNLFWWLFPPAKANSV